MKSSAILSLAALAGFSVAHPVRQGKRQSIASSDVDVLQFALTLEHLENVFYKQALSQFQASDFVNAGFASDFFTNLQFVAQDEQSHVQLLEGAIQGAGAVPVGACQYNFPFNSVQSFVGLSAILEDAGTSAYLGAAGLIQDKGILNTAAAITATEARHTAQLRVALGEVPSPNSLGTPVSANGIFTLAASFIVSCPSSNPPLPFAAFAGLAAAPIGCPTDPSSSSSSTPVSSPPASTQVVTEVMGRRQSASDATPAIAAPLADQVSPDSIGIGSGSVTVTQVEGLNIAVPDTVSVCAPLAAGQTAQFTATEDLPTDTFLTFVSGLDVTSVQAIASGNQVNAQIPDSAQGQTYVFVTQSAVVGSLDDSNIIAGPAVLEVEPLAPVIDNTIL